MYTLAFRNGTGTTKSGNNREVPIFHFALPSPSALLIYIKHRTLFQIALILQTGEDKSRNFVKSYKIFIKDQIEGLSKLGLRTLGFTFRDFGRCGWIRVLRVGADLQFWLSQKMTSGAKAIEKESAPSADSGLVIIFTSWLFSQALFHEIQEIRLECLIFLFLV